MTFVHDDADFDALLQIVSQNNRLGVGLVEKDYWVTHTLWALHAQGLRGVVQGRNLAVERL
jgi:hypothetical protein